MTTWNEMSDDLKDKLYPPGSIMGFFEKPDDSWELCDGEDGRPNLLMSDNITHKWYIRNFKDMKSA